MACLNVGCGFLRSSQSGALLFHSFCVIAGGIVANAGRMIEGVNQEQPRMLGLNTRGDACTQW